MFGIPIIYSEQACDPEYELVKRTWKERLFTRPWKPRQRYKHIMVKLNPQMYRVNFPGQGKKIIAHPSLKAQIEKIGQL